MLNSTVYIVPNKMNIEVKNISIFYESIDNSIANKSIMNKH